MMIKIKQRYRFQFINPNLGIKYKFQSSSYNIFVTFADFGNVPAIVCGKKRFVEKIFPDLIFYL